MGRGRFLFVLYRLVIMNEPLQIQPYTRPVQFPPASAPGPLPQMVSYNGQMYEIKPVQPGHVQFMSTAFNYLALAAAAGLTTGCILMLVSTSQQVITPTQPVVVEKPVPVPTTIKPNCIAFCGDQ